MTLQEVIRDERKEGRAQAVLDLLEELGDISKELCERVMSETDLETLKRWNKLAAKSETLEHFLQNM